MSSTVRPSGRSTSATSTAAGTGSAGKCRCSRRLRSASTPSRRQSASSWRGCEPSKRRRIRAPQIRGLNRSLNPGLHRPASPPRVSAAGSSRRRSSSSLKPGHLERHVEHRPPFGVRALGDRRGAFVADHRIERGHEDRIARQRLVEPRDVRLGACDAALARARARRWRAAGCDCSRLLAMSGSITLSWKLPDCPAIAIAASSPMTCAATMATASGNHRDSPCPA